MARKQAMDRILGTHVQQVTSPAPNTLSLTHTLSLSHTHSHTHTHSLYVQQGAGGGVPEGEVALDRSSFRSALKNFVVAKEIEARVWGRKLLSKVRV